MKSWKRTRLVLLTTGFTTAIAHSTLSPLFPAYIRSVGGSIAEIGIFFTVYPLCWVPLQVVAGHLADRFGRRKIACFGLFIYGSSTILMILANDVFDLIVLRIFQGVGLGLFGPSILGAVASLEEAGRSFAEFRTAQVTASIIGPIVGGSLAGISMHLPLLLSSAGAFSSILPLLWTEEIASKVKGDSTLARMQDLLRNKPLLLVCLSAFLAECVFASFEIVIPTFGSFMGWSISETGAVLSSYFISFVITQIPLGHLAERVGKRRVMIPCLISSSIVSLLMLRSDQPILFYLEMALLGVTLGGVFVQSTAIVGELAPEESKSLYMALFDSIIDLSFIVAPVLSTAFLTLNLRSNFMLWSLLFLLATFLFSLVKEPGGS